MKNVKIIFILYLCIFLSYGKNINAQSQTFSYTGSVQSWTVPCAVVVTIACYGAQGGSAESNAAPGGLGAEMVGTFTTTPGQVLSVVVGGQGVTSGANPGSGGGGGSGVVYNGTPWIIAGGGGGRNGGGYAAANASISNAGQAGSGNANGGSGGSDGGNIIYCSPNDTAYGGRGFNSGHNGSAGHNGYSAASCLTTTTMGVWGFGGGGGVGAGYCNCGGGGGGYSGGGGGGINGDGGGGGSYNIGSNQNNIAGVQSGNGSVVITWANANIPVTDTGKVLTNEITCNGLTGSARAKVTGVGLSYKWAPSGETTDTATGLSAGNYTVTVVSSCGTTVTSSVTITQPPNVITAAASTVTNVLCNGGKNGSATVTVNGAGTPYTYTWTPSGETIATATGLSAGIYTVKVVNACGASASATTTITQPNALSVTATTIANIDCYGNIDGSVDAIIHNGTLPYTYTWSPVGGNADTAVGLSPGSYTIAVTDNNGCTGTSVTTITQPAAALSTTLNVTSNVLCNGQSNGSINAITTGGTGPYTYAWTGGGTKNPDAGLSAGVYSLNLVDAHGCKVSASTVVSQPTAINIAKNTTMDIGNCTGSAWVVVTGGTAPYGYLWSNSVTQAYNGNLCPNTYCCTVKDANGCIDSVCVIIENVTGVSNISSGSGEISIYPNPNNGQFTIVSSATSETSMVEIYNVLGEKVYTTSLNSGNGGTSTINISNQPNGIYLYRVISSDNGNLVGQGKIMLDK